MGLDKALAKAVDKLTDRFKEDYGDTNLEDGDEIVGVFNDSVVIISKNGTQLDIKVICGEPYKFDEDAFNVSDEEA